MRALVIENCKKTNEMYDKLLVNKFELRFEYNGLDGFFAFQTAIKIHQPYDIIIMEINMPDLDGTQNLRMIRLWEKENNISREQGIPILISTSLEKYDYLINYAGKECDHIIFKPFTEDTIIEKLNILVSDLNESVMKANNPMTHLSDKEYA